MADLNEFVFWRAHCIQNTDNCLYPEKVVVMDAASFDGMARYDHVAATYKNSYRSNKNFEEPRVESGDADDEMQGDSNSIRNQKSILQKYADDRGFTNTAFFVDEGITGTNSRHRAGFNEMISDALDGKIDLIITKSVSRFTRNTVDMLPTIYKLHDFREHHMGTAREVFTR